MRPHNSFHVTISNHSCPRNYFILSKTNISVLFWSQMRLLLIWAMYWDGCLIYSSQYPFQKNSSIRIKKNLNHLRSLLLILGYFFFSSWYPTQRNSFHKGKYDLIDQFFKTVCHIFFQINSVKLLSPFSRAHWGVSIIAVSSSPQTGIWKFNFYFLSFNDRAR